MTTTTAGRPRIRFNRNELSGAFGDIGTDLPLLIGVALVAGLDGASVLILFGLMQIITGTVYRLPMPVQPLKAMAAIVIAQQVSADTLYGAGLAIGAVMLVLTLTGLLDWLARVVPKCVVRGVQFGLGLKLAMVALGDFVQADGASGLCLAGVTFALAALLLGNRRLPAALPIVVLGVVYALVFHIDRAALDGVFGLQLPGLHTPGMADIVTGFVVLALPQIPLSLGNSVLATRQMTQDLFPERALSIRKIGWSYSLMNLVQPWFGGIPTCHGSGGMAGHFAFGGRTGGSVILYGALFLTLGLFAGRGFDVVAQAFPLPMLGVLLLFEAITLIWLIRDTVEQRSEFSIVILVGLLAAVLPYGFVIGLTVGTALYYLRGWTRLIPPDVR